MKVHFLGAAGEVTGSCFLVDTGQCRFLVDCGMFQGGAEARAKNLNALLFDFDVREIDFVLVTHAHIDHSGLLPRLAMMGYRGPIYATPATVSLLEILLLDSAHIQEKESEWQLRHQHRQGKVPRVQPPLYTVTQAKTVLELLSPVDFRVAFTPIPEVRVCFHESGHILGSAWIEVHAKEGKETKKLVFSGDLGMYDRPVLHDPEGLIPEADLVVIESTYGNRKHRELSATEDEIVAAFQHTQAAGGNLVIPAFAVGRTQAVVYFIANLVRQGRIQATKIYIDSPMAMQVSRLTLAHPELLDVDIPDLIAWVAAHPEKISIEFVADVAASRALNQVKSGAVIISASGMCDAGRIKYHLRENLPRPESTILITGFQAAGTLGRRLVDGAKRVRIFGQELPVRARCYTVGGLSAHADQPALLNWLSGFKKPPRHIALVHGEASAAESFAGAIRERFSWAGVCIPKQGEILTV